MRAFSMPGRPDPMPGFDSLFDFLPIGAYRSRPDGTMVRANRALVRLNGYDSEAELLGAVHDIASEWYLDPPRRAPPSPRRGPFRASPGSRPRLWPSPRTSRGRWSSATGRP